MHVLVELWRSTVGRKALVALSGLLLGMWVVLHLLGNLTVFSGAATADGYAAALQQIPAWLWIARAGLAVAAVVHVGAPPWRWCPPRSPSALRRSPSRCSRGGSDDGSALRQRAGRAARLPLAATLRGSRARRTDAPSPPPRPRRGRRAGRRLRRRLAVGARLSRAVPGLP